MTTSAQDIVQWTKDYTLFEWAAQSAAAPLPVSHAKGVYFWTVDGRRFLDFNSQLMSVNIGHGDERVIRAIAEQAARAPYVNPSMTTEVRAVLGKMIAEVTPGNLKKSFFTLGGSEANEAAIRIARAVTGRQKILARWRSYHGGTAGSMTLTGEPRRWGAEPGIPGVVRIPDPYYYRCRLPISEAQFMQECLDQTEDIIQFEGPRTIAAMILETVTGTNGIIIPSEAWFKGIRALCDKYGILLIADEVMCGFGRTGKWFAVEHFGVQPDIMTVAKGLTSSYAPLGACVVSEDIGAYFDNRALPTGLTYNSHALSCAAAIACINVYKEDNLIERAAEMGRFLAEQEDALADKHPSVGEARHIGLFTIFELVKNKATREPMAPYNAAGKDMEVMNKVRKHLLDRGVFAFVRWNTVFANPPLCITREQIQEGLTAIDEALSIADEHTV